jgi:type II restriction/modification system DNA methylase subunit YeeA
MTPEQFIDKWSRADRTERQAAQEHFIDLCRMLGEPTPNEAHDPDTYSFEKGVSKTDGSSGFADVWKRGCFGWEYKKDRANLDRAYQQLQLYSVALENPPLLVVSDTKRFRIYTNWTNTVQGKHEFVLEDLVHTETRELLRDVFRNPEKLKPAKTREQVTKEAAKEFSTIAERLRIAGHAPEKVAHFLNRLVFCLFAEDVNLLQDDLFKRMLDTLVKRRDEVPARSQKMLSELFANMREGGEYGLEHILHFNGGLFNDDEALPLDPNSLDILRVIAKQDWSSIDPTIFGTLFERFLDPDKRAQIGAHYTDPEKIMMIVEPVILRPLTMEWEACKVELADILSKNRNKDGSPGRVALARAETRLDTFLKRLDEVRVLDPACGSGNFLYLAMQGLKDLERRAIVEAVEMGLALRVVHCGPRNVKGIEINQYAAELARTAIWIGNIQWQRRNGFEARKEPVLDDLDAIECRDALVTKKDDGNFEEAAWPESDFIIGNPPFLGSKWMLERLGDDYTHCLRSIFGDRIPSTADLVTYWFDKGRVNISAGHGTSVGLVATNMVRGSANRAVMQRIVDECQIFDAWSDEPWVVDGAEVRVSIVCFRKHVARPVRLDGQAVQEIFSDLTAGASNLTSAQKLLDNTGVAVRGIERGGAFDISGVIAREWLRAPVNPNGRPNADVLRPFATARGVTGRSPDKWVIDFSGMAESEAALFEFVFEFAKENIRDKRSGNREKRTSENWWLFRRSGELVRSAIQNLDRYIATGLVWKHRTFVWLPHGVVPDTRLVVVARDDDVTFGILCSRFHEAWTLRICQYHGVGNDPVYTQGTTFETFPFPEGLTPNIAATEYASDSRAIAIAKAAKRLDELRNAWLNPPDLIDIVPEVVPGYPDRILPKTEAAAAELKKRTLTNLYNARPQWLADAHRDLDAAVAAAYGWPADISEDDALAKLLELNLARSAAALDKAFDLTSGEADDGE